MNNYDHTILLAHGSRDPRWVEPFKTIYAMASAHHSAVSLAYMELCAPTLDAAVQQACLQGAKHIAVLPLFFAAGKHLREDIPPMLQQLSEALGTDLDLLAPVGDHELFQQAILNIIGELLN